MNDRLLKYYEEKAEESVSHHWVPQCYLKNFSIPEKYGTVFLYQKGSSPSPTGTKNIAAKNNLYTFEKVKSGGKTRAMEAVFAEHEREIAPILRSIASDRSVPSDNDRIAMATFVSLLAVRGPSFMDWLRNMDVRRQETMMRSLAKHPDMLKAHLKNAGLDINTDEQFQELHEAYMTASIAIKGGKEHYFKQAMKLSEDIYRVFLTRKSWHLLVAEGKRHFVTSDNPVVIQRIKGVPLHVAEGFGFGTILLTISPNVCLVLRSIPLTQPVVAVSPTDVEQINQSIMRSARRQIYSHISSSTIQAACDRYLNGGESEVFVEEFGNNSPYVMTKSIDRDIETQALEKYST